MIRVIIFYVIQFIYCNACPIKYVNPFIGTTGIGFGSGQMSPAAQLPFGALKLGPDTTTGIVNIPFRHCSGYNYYDNQIRSFSHTHLQGAGIADLGNFGIMPFSFNSLNDNNFREKNSWYSLFDKNSEKASPGFYEVDLVNENNNSKINVNLLAVSRFAGVHAYEWKNTDTHFPGVIIDLCHAAAENLSCKNPMVSFNEKNNEFNASLEFHGGLSNSGFEIFMTGKIIGGPVSERISCLDKSCNQSSHEDHIQSDTGILYNRLRFFPNTKKLRIQVALSFVSIDQALINYNDVFDLPLNSDGIEWLVNFGWRNRTELAWCGVLSKMQIEAPDSYTNDQKNELLMLTYTSYYRVLSSPTIYSEIGGVYMGLDKKVHNSHEDRKGLKFAGDLSTEFYSDLSLWDTFRTQMPFLLLFKQDVFIGVIRSMIDMASQNNQFPKWPIASVESNCMVGKHGMASIAEAILAGYNDFFSLSVIEPIIVRETTQPGVRAGIEDYLEKGYVPYETDQKAATLTLSYAFDDYSAGVIEQAFGDLDAADASFKRSLNYKNLWSSSVLFMCPRLENGELNCPRTSTSADAWPMYTEGDGEHWRWFVPHDIEGLLELFGDPKSFEKTLRAFFDEHVNWKLNNSLPNPYYWAGNEVDMMTPWLFNFVNCTYTQYWSRQNILMHYSTKPNGIPGNDDLGTMSSLVLFTSIGFYPQAGTTRFFVGSPLVGRATFHVNDLLSPQAFDDSIKLNSTHIIDIFAYENSPENIYVSQLLINGKEINSPFIDRKEFFQGDSGVTKIEFFMSSKPQSGLCPTY